MAGEPKSETASSEKRAAVFPLALTILFLILYFPVLVPLARQWLADPNYRHGLVVPVISGILLWRQRRVLREAGEGGGGAAGIILVLLASALLVGGTAASELFTSRLSIVFMLIGASLLLRGRSFTRKAAFPLLFLIMMIPLPYIVYYKITFPMQLVSARASTALLQAIQVNVIRKGNILLLPNYTLEVVAACSGLRSLMTMFTLALVFSAFSDLSSVRKVILVLLAAPVAVAANTLRLVVTGFGAYAVGPGFADGTLHEISGLIVFFAGFLMLMACVGILKWTR